MESITVYNSIWTELQWATESCQKSPSGENLIEKLDNLGHKNMAMHVLSVIYTSWYKSTPHRKLCCPSNSSRVGFFLKFTYQPLKSIVQLLFLSSNWLPEGISKKSPPLEKIPRRKTRNIWAKRPGFVLYHVCYFAVSKRLLDDICHQSSLVTVLSSQDYLLMSLAVMQKALLQYKCRYIAQFTASGDNIRSVS
jgi:hypothetical protein